MDVPTNLNPDTQKKILLPILLFSGVLLLLTSLLRVFHWNYRDIIFLAGTGLALILLSLEFRLGKERSSLGLAGFALSIAAVLIYYLIEKRASDLLAFLYAAGLALLVTDILLTRFFGEIGEQMREVSRSLREGIRNAIQPQPAGVSCSIEELSEMAVDLWRLERRVEKIRGQLPESHILAFEHTIHRFRRLLDKYQIEIVDLTGRKYYEGLNVEILSIQKSPGLAEPLITETIEPSIVHGGKVVKRARVIVTEKG
jgi:hypothetical protein